MKNPTFMEYLLEDHHDYSEHSNFTALHENDTITVYHGFNKFSDAMKTAKQGISGSGNIDRLYQFQNDINPNGLFVTSNIRTAMKYAKSQIVICFDAYVKDLKSPLGSEHATNDMGIHIQTSHDPAVASSLMNKHFSQALFVGNLSPKNIKFFYYIPENRKYSPQEFLADNS